jgi:chaperonin GroES
MDMQLKNSRKGIAGAYSRKDKKDIIKSGSFTQAAHARLNDLIHSRNIVDLLDEEEVNEIGKRVIEGYERDKQSMQPHLDEISEGVKLAKMIRENKSHPWPGASNVTYPLMANAVIQFAARAYPAIIAGPRPAKARIIGKDDGGFKKERADRISEHMSYQLTDEIPDWEEGMDRLFHVLPLTGDVFKKTYHDPREQVVHSPLLLPGEVVINAGARGLDSARRITHVLAMHKNQVIELQRLGVWSECELSEPSGTDENGEPQDSADDATPHIFIEQHRWLDLDYDGYEEPYIVTCEENTGKVMRIVARYNEDGIQIEPDGNKHRLIHIEAVQFFTRYQFIPAFDNTFFSIGFSKLLGAHNHCVNTLINQLIDAGTLSNGSTGFYSGELGLSGELKFRPGEWKSVDAPPETLQTSFFPLPVREPSQVLFLLLQLLIEAGRQVTNVAEVMSGQTPPENTPATTVIALIEQGMKVFTGVYKRIYRSFTQELEKIAYLNSRNLEAEHYFRILDEEEAMAVYRSDYEAADCDVRPTADPNMSSETLKMAQAQALIPFAQDPTCDGRAIKRRYFEAVGVEDIDEIMPEQMQTAPDPKLLKESMELEIEEKRLELDRMEMEAKVTKMLADASKAIAEAEAVEPGQQLEQYKAHLSAMKDYLTMRNKEMDRSQRERAAQAKQAGFDGAGGTSGQPGVSQVSGDIAPGAGLSQE